MEGCEMSKMQTLFKTEDHIKVAELEKMKVSLELQLKEMSKMVEEQQQVIAMSKRDPLTGLRNRAGVSEQVDNYLRLGNKGIFFIMDMDNFKAVNDTYGHLEGDKVLVKFAKALKRAVDLDDIVARLGGDEFIIFSPYPMEKDEVRDKARRLIRNIERELVTPGRLVRVTVSMGIAMAPNDGVIFDTLYCNSDKALYFVKNSGKNSFRFYDEIETEISKQKLARTQLSLAEITGKIREKKMEGSLVVEYSNFEKIYRFMERNIAREKREVQCVLFTMDINDEKFDEITVQRSMEHLQHAVSSSLRKGDVTTNYSSSQVLALLMDVNQENANIVIGRIMDKYRKEAGQDAINVSCDAEALGSVQ